VGLGVLDEGFKAYSVEMFGQFKRTMITVSNELPYGTSSRFRRW
jgi:hypothetical protein